MTNRAAAAAATRKKLISNADRLLYEKGYHDMSIVDITKASGVAKGTFYNYFATKEDLLLQLSKNHLQKVTNSVPTLANEDPSTSIRHYLVNYLQVVVNSGDNMARQWIRFVVDPKNHQKWEFDLDSLSKLIQLLVSNQKLAKRTPIPKISQLLMTEVYGIVFSWCMSPSTIDPVETIKEFCDLQLNAILRNGQNG